MLLFVRLSELALCFVMPIQSEMFGDLLNLQSTLSPNNQKLIPALIKVFSDFKTQLADEMKFQFSNMLSDLKEQCVTKDQQISELQSKYKSLQDKVSKLENRFDDEDAYTRRESLIFSGDSVLKHHDNSNCIEVVQKVVKDCLKIELKKEDISVSHRLGPKSAAQGQDTRSIIVKFCRRDQKRDLLLACRSSKPRNLYLNECLTPLRRNIGAALRRAKKLPSSRVSGMTTIDGRIFVWGKSDLPGTRDSRHCVNTLQALEDFCMEFVGCHAADVLPRSTEASS